MSSFIDLAGQEFGLWVVLYRNLEKKSSTAYWICRCICGFEKSVSSGNLRSGQSKGCKKCTHLQHGKSRSTEYRIWTGIRQRCNNPKNKRYPEWGGRGIKVCARWEESFENFLADMGPRPGPEYSIDRLNNDGNYEPDNCAWRTSKEQQNNTRGNKFLTLNGETKTISQWAEETGILKETINSRLRSGWSDEDALTKSVRKKNNK